MKEFKHAELYAASILNVGAFKLAKMSITERIRTAIEQSGQSKSAVAKLCNVSPSAVTQWLSGETKAPTAEKLLKLSRATGVSYTWLVDGKGDMKGGNIAEHPAFKESNVTVPPKMEGYVPVISWVQAGAWTEMCNVDFLSEELVPRPPGCSDCTFALRVKGQSMAPRYNPGTIIYIDPEVMPFDGDDVVAILTDSNEATFKQYVEEPGESKMLKARNPNWPEPWVSINGNCQIIGVVIADLRMRVPRTS